MLAQRILVSIAAAASILVVIGLGLSLLLYSEDPSLNSSKGMIQRQVEFIPYSISIRNQFLAEKNEVRSTISSYKSHSIRPDIIETLEYGTPDQIFSEFLTAPGLGYELFPFVIDIIPQREYIRGGSEYVESLSLIAARWLSSKLRSLIAKHEELEKDYRVDSGEFRDRYLWSDTEELHLAWMELWLKLRANYDEFS